MKSLIEKFVVLCGIIVGAWLTYVCAMMLLISTQPEKFKEYEVYPGTFMLMGSCYTPRITDETVEGFYRCLGHEPTKRDIAWAMTYASN